MTRGAAAPDLAPPPKALMILKGDMAGGEKIMRMVKMSNKLLCSSCDCSHHGSLLSMDGLEAIADGEGSLGSIWENTLRQ